MKHKEVDIVTKLNVQPGRQYIKR